MLNMLIREDTNKCNNAVKTMKPKVNMQRNKFSQH